MLPDRISMYDNLDLLPPPSADFLASQLEEVTSTPFTASKKSRPNNRDINLQEDFNNSQFLHDTLGDEDEMALANNDDLGLELDFGMDIDERPTKLMDKSVSMEMGRDAPAARSIEDDMFSELDMGFGKEQGEREASLGLDLDFGDDVRIADNEGDIQMGDDDFQFNLGDQSAMPAATRPDMTRTRISESPLSDIDETFAKEVEMEYSRTQNADMYEPGDDPTATIINAPQRQKKRKLLQPDDQTMLTSQQIKEQQAKRDNILKPQTFVAHDPYIIGLEDLHKSGGFIHNILFEGRSDGWAPELKGLLSLGSIRPNELKRKRDSGVADMESDEEHGKSKSPRLELPDDETVLGLDATVMGNQSVAADGTVLDIPADETVILHDDDHNANETHVERSSPVPDFDETAAPIVHPADSGPVSIGTKHAVHILRDLFGEEAATNADKRKKTAVVFQELLPENKTSKADATKMFFECLVLATKDAIKVEQPEGTLGGHIRVRGKRGLWGDWAEREAGGEMAREQSQQHQGGEAGHTVTSAATVSVEA